MEIRNSGNIVTVRLNGDIDHHSLSRIRGRIDEELTRTEPELLLLDFSDVGFMDSSGIGLILGRMRIMSGFSGTVKVIAPKGGIRKIITLAGLEQILAEKT